MKKVLLYSLLPMLFIGATSCKEKRQSDIIIARKPVVIKKSRPQVIGDAVRNTRINWVGGTYTVRVTVRCDTSLPLASDGDTKYYDNRVNIHISRSDGSSFFDRTFTKSDFSGYVDKAYFEDGALLGIVFNKVEGESLKFAASIGNPDRSSDEFVPLEIVVSHLGRLSIQKSSDMDDE